jgi:DNA-directed RNA polymerase specialized sigma24 family protein
LGLTPSGSDPEEAQVPDKNRVGYEAFAKWELELAEGKAKGVIGKHGFTQQDFHDLRQEMLLQVHLKRETRKRWSEITASEKTVMSRILDNRLKDIIDAIHTDKRKVHLLSDPIAEPDEPKSDSTSVIDEETLFKKSKEAASVSDPDLLMDLESVMRDLNEVQKRVYQLLFEGQSVSDVARQLRIKRTTLNREIDRMRKIFYRRGLKAYI